ncbi:MAG: HTH domain-containing protein [Clostridiaceae bacterium]|nr:HTH domain-containing protein [Clostridiaceae bacterium]
MKGTDYNLKKRIDRLEAPLSVRCDAMAFILFFLPQHSNTAILIVTHFANPARQTHKPNLRKELQANAHNKNKFNLIKPNIMIFKHINRLQQINQLIRQKRTGNAEELAEKLKISRRQVYNWIEELKSYGLDIAYNREIKSFVYLKPYQINITLDIKELTVNETTEIEAGIDFLKKSLFVQ